MPNTLRDYREKLATKLGGHTRGTVSLDPDITDLLAQRSIISSDIFDADKNSKGYNGHFAWFGKYKDSRRCRDDGYRSLAYGVYTAPSSGTYTLTFYGYGATDPIAFDAVAEDVQDAIVAAHTSLAAVTVDGDGAPFIIHLPDVIDVEFSGGNMIANGGIGAIEVNRSFTKAMIVGDEFELSAKLPITDLDDFQGLNGVINSALRRMWFIDRFPITPLQGQRGIPTFYGLTGFNWLTSSKQMIAIYAPTEWSVVATFTHPESSTYTMQLDMATATYTTASLAFNATGQQLQDALTTALDGAVAVTVSPTTLSSAYTITIASTLYATPTFTPSAGTLTHARTMLASPARSSMGFKYQYDGEAPFLDNHMGQLGASFYVEAYRPTHNCISPQASYGTEGDTWEASNNGLLDDYDMAIPDVDDVATVAYFFACEQLATVGPSGERDAWKKEALEAGGRAAAINLYDLPFDDKPRGGNFSATTSYGSKGFWYGS